MVETLIEAVILVFIVMYVFLQNIRYTLIPTIVVPVALLGSFATLLALGFSINVLTMFGMVLVIGIVVDDAIVVVENVERIMSEEGLPPLPATRKAMGQISGAIIGVTVVLISVFVPLAFFAGAVGNIYRQFSAVMVSSIAFSAFLALSLTPALCAHLLKPVEAGHHMEKRGFFGWFNRTFSTGAKRYEGFVGKILQAHRPRAGRVRAADRPRRPDVRAHAELLPAERRPGLHHRQHPAAAGRHRRAHQRRAARPMEDYVLKQPEVADMVAVTGFSFSGQGQNMGLAFIPLKPWDERKGKGQDAQSLAGRITMHMGALRDSFIFVVSPPPIPELGRGTGFSFRLQDRGGLGHAALLQARNQLLGMAMQSPVLTGIRPEGLEDAPQLQLDIDRDKAQALGVTFDAINTALSTSLGSALRERLPERRPPAARDRAGRRAATACSRKTCCASTR